MNIPDPSGDPRRLLDALINQGPAHLVPIWIAVRDHRVIFALIDQSGRPFPWPATNRPSIVLLGDDTETAHGPAGFDHKSIREVIGRAQAAIVISCAALPTFYAHAAAAAVLGLNVVIVETRPEQEIPWIEFVQSVRPGLPTMVGTVAGAGA